MGPPRFEYIKNRNPGAAKYKPKFDFVRRNSSSIPQFAYERAK